MKGGAYSMLKRFTLRNYKNFRDKIEIDFGNIAGYQFSTDCITNGVIAKMLIYGRNATGKRIWEERLWILLIQLQRDRNLWKTEFFLMRIR